MTTIKIVGREFFGKVNSGYIYITKSFRELLGIENGDVLLLEIKEFKSSAERDSRPNTDKSESNKRVHLAAPQYRRGIEPPNPPVTSERDDEKVQPPNLTIDNDAKISVENLQDLFKLPHTVEEVASLMHRHAYDVFVELEGLVVSGRLRKDGKKYFLREGEAR